MLNFIVLGYVPGTSFQIDFYNFMLFVFSMLTILLALTYVQMRLSRRKFQSTLGFCLRSLSRQLQRSQTASLVQ